MQDGYLTTAPLTMELILFLTAPDTIYKYAPDSCALRTQTLGVGPGVGSGDCATDVVGLGWCTLELFGAVGWVGVP